MLGCALLSGLVAGCATKQRIELLATGDQRQLRPRSKAQPERARGHADVVVIALDGVDRALLYELLQSGKLPQLGRLLFSDHGAFPHAYFEDNMLSTLPSTTLAAWVTAFTGEPPAVHGITGNEFFVREDARFVSPSSYFICATAARSDVVSRHARRRGIVRPPASRVLAARGS